MVLVGVQVGVFVGGIVEDLDFLAHISRIAFQRGVDAEAVVCARRQLKLEPEVEIAVFSFGKQVAATAAAFGLDHNHPILNDIRLLVAHPAVEVFAIEKDGEDWFR